jgi:hypothetical protein
MSTGKALDGRQKWLEGPKVASLRGSAKQSCIGTSAKYKIASSRSLLAMTSTGRWIKITTSEMKKCRQMSSNVITCRQMSLNVASQVEPGKTENAQHLSAFINISQHSSTWN